MNQQNKRSKKAFTIIEFMLAMTFLAVLLMGIATVTMQILEIYRKGLALRAVNAVGRDILNDMTRTISGSPIVENINPEASGVDIGGNKNITENDIMKAYRSYYSEVIDSYGNTAEDDGMNVQWGGIFCTGSYDYVWNTAPAIRMAREDAENIKNMFTINGKYYKLARIPDKDRSNCAVDPDNDNKLKTTKYSTEENNDDLVVSLISDDDSDLALYDFVVLPATQNNKTGQIFYSGMFILATMRGGVNIMTNGDFCTGTETMYSSEVESTNQEFNYCAVNKFNFAMRATGESRNADQFGGR